jgi:hypothetical protein
MFVIVIALLLFLMGLSACSNQVSLVSSDGEKWLGRWRYGRGDNGFMQIVGADGEVLMGAFARVPRQVFVDGYEQTFGPGTIAMDGLELSQYGSSFASFFGASSAFRETAYAEPLDGAPGKPGVAVSGPLFYWMANLQGDRRTSMQCFLIGSSYTGKGIGRCRGPAGKDYLVEF